MSDKNFVSVEQNVCPVCGHTFNTGNILMDKRVRKRFDPITVTGMSLCPEHQKQLDEGYIFLVELEDGTVPEGAKSIHLKDANRTGVYAAIKKEVADHLFERIQLDIINFVDEQVIPMLQQMQSSENSDVSADTESA